MFFSSKKINYFKNRQFLPASYQTSLKFPNDNLGFLQFVLSIMNGMKLGFFLTMLAAIVSVAMDYAYGPIFAQWFVRVLENYNGPRSEVMNVVLRPFIVMMILWISGDVIWRAGSWYYSKKFEPTLDAKIKISFLDRVMRNSYEFFITNETGRTIGSLYTILYNVKCVIKKTCRSIIPHFITCVFLVVSLCFVHWKICLIMTMYVVIYTIIFALTSKKILRLRSKTTDATNRTISGITDILMNISSVILFSRKRHEIDKIKKIQNFESKRIERAEIFLEKIKILRVIISFLLLGIFYGLVLFDLYKHSIINMADVVYAMTACGECAAVIFVLQEDILDLIADFGSVKRGLGIMNEGKIAENTVNGGADLVVHDGGIVMKNMSFGYYNNVLFDNLNFEIKPKEKIGLAGRSGSGKTTFINLILRNLTPISGQVLIDGNDISYVSDNSLKDNISVVSQDTTLFNRSVLENIIYSRPSASFEEVVEVAKKANAHGFIMELENGYDTNVGEKGMRLSGGQRQRILIARAMLKNAPILILDEATSALDAESEKFVNESLSRLMEGRTVIAIAHRLQTLRKMDRIIVLQKGEIVEHGKHDDLVESSSIYRSLWRIQTEGILVED